MFGETLDIKKYVKIHEDRMYSYYVSKEQDFRKGIAATPVYVTFGESSKDKSVKYVQCGVITKDFKFLVPFDTDERNQRKTGALKYLATSSINKKIERIGDYDFLVTIISYHNKKIGPGTSTVHVRIDENLEAKVIAEGLPNLIPTNAPGLALTPVEDGFQLYDVFEGKLLDVVYSKINTFKEEEKDGKKVWRAIVEDSYSTGDTEDDIKDVAYFKIDEHGNIVSKIYFQNDSGVEESAIDPNVPGFNYAEFKRQKIDQMNKKKEIIMTCKNIIRENIKQKVEVL